MEANVQMMNNVKVMTVKVSEKEFFNKLKFVSKIAEESKNKGKAVLIRKVENKLIMCSGGIKSSVAMVPMEIEGDAGECKGFVDGKDIIDKLSRSRSKNDMLEIRFEISKSPNSSKSSRSCIILKNDKGKLAVGFDAIEEGTAAQGADSVISQYRNAVVERAYRIVRDVESKGLIQLKYKDFLDLEKSFTHTTYTVAGQKFIDFRVFLEVQNVKKKVQDLNNKNAEKEVWLQQEFPIIEGIGYVDNSMGICRKYGLGIGLPTGENEIRMVVDSELLNHVSSAIGAMKEVPVKISRGVDEMCITAGEARFIFPVKEIPLKDARTYFREPYRWKITVNTTELREVVDLLSRYMDQANDINRLPALNSMIVNPLEKKITFKGVGTDGFPVERYVEYRMAVDNNGREYKDFDVDKVNLNLQRKYIREFLDSCKSKEVSFGTHIYIEKRKKMNENRMYEKDSQGNFILEECQRGLISIEDANQGIYGVHHRIKI